MANRPHGGEAEWRERVARWRASGLGARQFAAGEGVSVETLRRWVRRLGPAVAFVEVAVPEPVAAHAELCVGAAVVRMPLTATAEQWRSLLDAVGAAR